MIRVDVFHVELGASILLQFRDANDEAVNVLVDAGAHGGNFPKDHVRSELREALKVKPEEPFRIDLLVGTHYDSDHLNQMVAIIDDKTIDIAEAWMPPVADDTEDPPADLPLNDMSLLALKFAGSFEDQSEFRKYMTRKQAEIADNFEIAKLIGLAVEGQQRDGLAQIRPVAGKFAGGAQGADDDRPQEESSLLGFFQDVLQATPGQLDSCAHATVPESGVGRELSDWFEYPNIWHRFRRSRWMDNWRNAGSNKAWLRAFASEIQNPAMALQRLALLRGTSAKQAVNAAALNEVVVALKRRNVPVFSRRITDGQPRRFSWDSGMRKFVEAASGRIGGIDLTLLGPSDSLIRKHWHRLPKAVKYEAAIFLHTIPIVSISPSNQLSYVLHFKAEEQGILISGDTGCNDFKLLRGSGEYFPDLIAALSPLNVVQVAHHGGANAHFYRVLQAAAPNGELAETHFLLSHEQFSKSRPSHEFRLFVGNARGREIGPKLLFTSAPKLSNVFGYEDLIHQVAGTKRGAGNIVMEFRADCWHVVSHAVDAAQLTG